MRYAPSIITAEPIGYTPGSPVQEHALGLRVTGNCIDYNTTAGFPNGGSGEFVYVQATATIPSGSIVHIDTNWNILVVPTTANTGRPVAVAVSDFTATNAFGWVQLSGIVPIKTSVAATVGPVFVGTAGVVTPAAAAGKQLLNATCLIAASGTLTKKAKTFNGLTQLEVVDTAGLYPGIAVSGTGIPGGATVSKIDAGGRLVTLSAAATASGLITATFTHTGYGVFHISHSFVQGQIT